jgi:hypothetical protein
MRAMIEFQFPILAFQGCSSSAWKDDCADVGHSLQALKRSNGLAQPTCADDAD